MPERINFKRKELETISALEYYNYCLGLKFDNPPEVISLSLISQAPEGHPKVGSRDIAVSVADQCYKPGVTEMGPRPSNRDSRVADSTGNSGHLTTRQHDHFTFKIKCTRRLMLEIHDNPFYNSDFQSQRFVEADYGNFMIPEGLTEAQRNKYVESANSANEAYKELLKALNPEVDKRIRKMYPEGGWKVEKTKKRLEGKIKKISQEVARFVLPICQFSYGDYTVNQAQLIRLFMGSTYETSTDEQRYMLAKMIEKVSEVDPQIIAELRMSMVIERSYGENEESIVKNKKEFDQDLDGKTSNLEILDSRSRHVLASAIRNVLGQSRDELTDEMAIEMVFDPKRNKLLADVWGTGIVEPLYKTLRTVLIGFSTKNSLVGNEQRHRHRRTANASPPLESTFDGTADYYIPTIVTECPEILTKYQKMMVTIFDNINNLIEMGVSKKDAMNLLPGAYNIRVHEVGDLLDWINRWHQRLCILAQEEIGRMSIDQVDQFLGVFPEARNALLAPCSVLDQAEVGRCPEGDRWCGLPMWREKNVNNYINLRLV